jgi:hypothetical protein
MQGQNRRKRRDYSLNLLLVVGQACYTSIDDAESCAPGQMQCACFSARLCNRASKLAQLTARCHSMLAEQPEMLLPRCCRADLPRCRSVRQELPEVLKGMLRVAHSSLCMTIRLRMWQDVAACGCRNLSTRMSCKLLLPDVLLAAAECDHHTHSINFLRRT